MSFALRPFDFDDPRELAQMARWSNDPEIKHLASIYPDEATFRTVITASDILRGRPGKGSSVLKRSWMLLLDGTPVGEGSVALDPPQLLTKERGTAWMGILIGEASARGRGYGSKFFALLEEEARKLGAKSAELGVFEFNPRAIRMYERMGYRRIGEVPALTWWNSRKWADLRYFKDLAR